MPEDEPDPPLVVDEVDDWLGEGADQAAVGDVPHLDYAVFGAAGDYVVVVGTPGDVEDGALVTADEGVVSGDTADLEAYEGGGMVAAFF